MCNKDENVASNHLKIKYKIDGNRNKMERGWSNKKVKDHKNQEESLGITMREMQLNPKAREIERR
jgi:hypothetical protein